MDLKAIVIFLMTLFAAVLGQVQNASNGEYLKQLNFTLREEKLPNILNYVLDNNLEVYDIQTQDIISLSKLDKYNLDEFLEVLRYFHISPKQAFTVDSLENLLETFDLEFLPVYTRVAERLNASSKMSQILESLSIPVVNFTFALLGNQYIYDILREGVYDEDHVNASLQILGKTEDEVYVAFRDTILSFITQLNSTHFVRILKDNGLNKVTGNELYKALNITTRDVYNVEKFRDILTNITSCLNDELVLGVFTAPNKLVVHELIYNRSFLRVDGSNVRIKADEVEVNARKEGNVGTSIVELLTQQSTDAYIETALSYNSSEDCLYVTISDGKLSVESVEVADLTVNKTAGVQFNLGSPLICEDRLYGLAREETDEVIVFDNFYTEENPPPPDHADNKATSHSFYILSILTFNVFVCFTLL